MTLMDGIGLTVLIVFGICMAIIFAYSLVQLTLVINYLKSKKAIAHSPKALMDYPQVTIQLPIYNELYVVERLIDTICQLDYPKDKLEIQVLDDSTDETVGLIRDKVDFYQKKGIDIVHIRRPNRVGYKAGALKYGTEICKGEFIGIFDADFLPNSDFLLKTIPYFANEKVGVVQTRWGYVNDKYSWLTKLQSFGLNAHFRIEQLGRSYNQHFINFNGTGGVWRKSCIEDAGGWEADTLTEDLDLSYRAQLKQWKFIYLEDVESPSELPVEINALKQQQFRWTKGAAECTVKNLKRVVKAKDIKRSTKLHAIFHLMNSSVFVLIFLMAILTLPLVFIKNMHPEYIYLMRITAVFMSSWFFLGLFYFVAFYHNKGKNILEFLGLFLGFLAVSMGLSLHNSIAVIEGYMGKKSPFIRTPKFNIENANDWKQNKYVVKKITPLTILEGLFLIYFVYTFYQAYQFSDYGIMPMLFLLIFGFGFVFLNSLIHLNKAKS
ncbi:MAG: cellulose synthase family protein [Putridiphycobacter sp.]